MPAIGFRRLDKTLTGRSGIAFDLIRVLRAGFAASEPGSPINVRDRASTSGEVRTVGYSGDRIQIADKTQDDDGTVWYSVRFDSGATGWVRSDFVNW